MRWLPCSILLVVCSSAWASDAMVALYFVGQSAQSVEVATDHDDGWQPIDWVAEHQGKAIYLGEFTEWRSASDIWVRMDGDDGRIYSHEGMQGWVGDNAGSAGIALHLDEVTGQIGLSGWPVLTAPVDWVAANPVASPFADDGGFEIVMPVSFTAQGLATGLGILLVVVLATWGGFGIARRAWRWVAGAVALVMMANVGVAGVELSASTGPTWVGDVQAAEVLVGKSWRRMPRVGSSFVWAGELDGGDTLYVRLNGDERATFGVSTFEAGEDGPSGGLPFVRVLADGTPQQWIGGVWVDSALLGPVDAPLSVGEQGGALVGVWFASGVFCWWLFASQIRRRGAVL